MSEGKIPRGNVLHLFSVIYVCYGLFVGNFVSMFVCFFATLRESIKAIVMNLSEQMGNDHAVKFARWQHPAMGAV